MGDPHAGPGQGRVGVVVDTSIGVDPDVANALGIRLVAFQLIIDGSTLRDAIDIKPEEFFADLERMHELPRTSSPSPGDWLDVFEGCWADGLDVLAVTCASTVTASHKAARVAAAAPARATRVVDSRTASAGEYLVAAAAARAAASGLDLDCTRAVVDAVAGRVRVLGTLNRFDFLKRSGRVSAVGAFAAGRLHMNPVFQMVDGEAKSYARTRSRDDALDRIAATVVADAATRPGERLHVAAMHAACPDDASRLLERVDALGAVEIATTNFTPVMGVHTGPGIVGLGWWWEPEGGIEAAVAAQTEPAREEGADP
ncbi:MAG: DegV family protein [Acidimicrobiia bacterium]|nr:DegV family protein [Acidimicrobiia bacterium]